MAQMMLMMKMMKNMKLSPVFPITDDETHRAALARIDEIFYAEPGTPEGAELDALATLVEHYEEVRWPIATPSPLAALKFGMEQQGATQTDLAQLLGSRSRASEILAGKREMTLEQIRQVVRAWRIPASLLIGVEAVEHA